MDELLLHPLTRQALKSVLRSSHHAIALVGPYGAGKGFLATKLVETLLGLSYKGHQVFRLATNEAIGIEDIRGLQSFLRLKTTGTGNIRRVIIIEDAQNLTIEAQNALLKTLEEPPADTKIILTITDMNSLRQTIYSRLQIVHIQPVASEQATNYFTSQGYDKNIVHKAFLISSGHVGLCSALIKDSGHKLIHAISDAKTFLAAPVYDRLLKVDALAKDKDQAALLLFAVKRVLSAATKNSKDEQFLGAMAKRLKVAYNMERSLPANPNMKLLLTNFALNL